MRIQRNQEILGYPAMQIRQLMRETIRGRMTLQGVQGFSSVRLPPRKES